MSHMAVEPGGDPSLTPSESVLLHAGQFARFERQVGRAMVWLFFALASAVAPSFVARNLIEHLRSGTPFDRSTLAIAVPAALISVAFFVAAYRAVFHRNPAPAE